jgi:hypothetical protein
MRTWTWLVSVLAVISVACKSDEETAPAVEVTADVPEQADISDVTPAPLSVSISLPEAHPGLNAAASDLVDVVAQVSGSPAGVVTVGALPAEAGGKRVVVTLSAGAGPDDEGYALQSTPDGIAVAARTPVGAMAGLYQIAADLGAFWLHPEETFVARNAAIVLPTYDGAWSSPRFALRGFHEHTQHPIPMSDYLLRPGVEGFRERVSRYLRWMARNRQNVLFFHLLKTVDFEAWTPWMQSITAEAAGYGIHMGCVTGFADEQQNAFKLISTGAEDADAAIRKNLDTLLATGLDRLGLQIGTSEFTKPNEADVLHWLEVTTSHLADKHPKVQVFAWIHVPCDLQADDGGSFFHLPLKSGGSLGALVHTTMFYSLDVPAPVYGCEEFGHQLDFIDAAEGKRPLVFFPETAWWLGFDNNVPLVLPITGASRSRDLATLEGRDVVGHVTFTTGREWTYWQYDHYLTRATWTGETWADYLSAITPVYGEAGPTIIAAIQAVGALQETLLYKDNPELLFYLAGELPQDEAGAAAGILARRPKIAFKTVYGYDQATFDTWKSRDYDRLVAFRDALAPVVAPLAALAAESGAGEPGVTARTLEAVEAYTLLLRRVEHAIAVYGGTIAVRAGDRAAAEAALAAAREISEEVKSRVAKVEAIYRDPFEILAAPKPESLTSYPFGYLAETHTAYFWTRRDDQLDDLITAVFDAKPEVWTVTPAALYGVVGDGIRLTSPDSAMGASVLGGFIPRLLLGLTPGTPNATLVLAEDANLNALPDPGSELTLSAPVTAGHFIGTTPRFDLVVHDAAGKAISTVGLLDLALDLTIDAAGAMGPGTMATNLETEPLVQAALALVGIDREGIESLIKGVFLLPADQPLPATLPCEFALTPTKLD